MRREDALDLIRNGEDSGLEFKPVPGSKMEDLDFRRLRDYFVRVLGGNAPADGDAGGWETLLRNFDLLVVSAGKAVPTVDGMLLFGRDPKRFVPQSGIRALSYPGTRPDYAARADLELKGPLVPLLSADGSLLETGLVEQALDFLGRNTEPTAHLENGRRIDRPAYPVAVIREAVVNALVHRDYSVAGTDISLIIFSDRLEIHSPGRLPNTVTVERMKAGYRHARNQTLVNVMRDYRYVEFRGMGVRDKIIPGMREFNGTDPDLVAEEFRFIVRLWKEKDHG